jgi:hypothetical protein
MNDAEKRVRALIDTDWSSLVTKAAMQIQTMAPPLNRLVSRAGMFAESEEGKNLLEGMRKIMEAQERAEILSDAIHNAGDIGEIQKVVSSMQIDAVTLMSLIVIERGKEASSVEVQAENKAKVALSERASAGGQARILNDKDGKQAAKNGAYEFWRNHTYKGPAEFARAMLDKYPALENQKTVEDWYREWKKGINLPRTM